jgi:signal peptidase I
MASDPHTKSLLRRFLGVLVFLSIILIVTTGTRAYAAQSYFIPSPSMSPTLEPGDRVVVDKLFSTVHRGDIVVFNRAPGDTDLQYPVLVKRVIGLPGERISSSGDTIYIDGQPIAQPWLPELSGICSQSAFNIPAQRIPSGHYFVMGDCRGDSSDSRYWGTVPQANIIGKVTAIVWRDGHPWIHWF